MSALVGAGGETLSFTKEIVGAAASLRFEDLPGDVVEIVRQCVLDWVGVTLAGSREPGPAMVLAELAAFGTGTATVVGDRKSVV